MSSDLEDIRRLAADYCWHVDRLQHDALMELFTEDVQFDARPIGLELFSGRAALSAFFNTVLAATAHSQHMSGNHRIDLDGDVATGTSYYLAQGGFKDGGTFFAAGYYEDRYVRTADGWLIDARAGIPFLPAEVEAITTQLER